MRRWDEQPANKPQARTRCPWCRKLRPVNSDGTLRKHPGWVGYLSGTTPGPCEGSRKRPEEFGQ